MAHTRLTAFFQDYPGEPVPDSKTNLDFTEARDSEWQWHQLGYTQVCTLLQTDNHTSTSPLCFLQAGCPSCHQTNSVKAQKAIYLNGNQHETFYATRAVNGTWSVWLSTRLQCSTHVTVQKTQCKVDLQQDSLNFHIYLHHHVLTAIFQVKLD